MSNEALSEDEFNALTNRVVAALDAAPDLPLYSVEYAAPEWRPRLIGVLLKFRSREAEGVAYRALERAGLPSERLSDHWNYRIVLGDAAAKARGWTIIRKLDGAT